MSTIGTTLFSKIEINGQEVDIATLDANDGIYALPAGYTTANVKFTMIDNTSIPRGVFEENSYITAMTLPDAMAYIASYSFHGVNNINISDKNAILAINPYAFDAEPTPSGTDPDIYFDNSEITLDYYTDHSKLDGNRKTQSLRGDNKDDTAYITWSTSDTTIATVQGNGYVIAHGNGTVNIIVDYAAHDNYNSKTVQYQLTITNYKLYSTGQWYNDGNPVSYIEVSKGGSNTYNLTFTSTPSDSWTFSILASETINGVSVDSTTGTITINESQLNTTGGVAIEARRQTDASYYEGSTMMQIDIKQASKALTVLSNSFVNANEDSTTSETFTIGHLDTGGRIGSGDLAVTYDSNSAADITISNVSITHNDLATETDAIVSFDLRVLQGVGQGETVYIYAELTDNGSGYYMERMPVGNISLIPAETTTVHIDTTRLNPQQASDGMDNTRLSLDIYSDNAITVINTMTQNMSLNNTITESTYTPDGIYNHKYNLIVNNITTYYSSTDQTITLTLDINPTGTDHTTTDITVNNPYYAA